MPEAVRGLLAPYWDLSALRICYEAGPIGYDTYRLITSLGHACTEMVPTMKSWIAHRDAKQRLFGITATAYCAVDPAKKAKARKDALEKLEARFEGTFQRRHDCIHNCDRPKVAGQPITDAQVEKQIKDIEFLVALCDEVFLQEFPAYLIGLGFSVPVRNQVMV